MGFLGMDTAATGLSAMSQSLEITANNLANSQTPGFKSSRANFEDLFYMEYGQPGAENSFGDERPTGLYIGLGTAVSGTQLDFNQGPAQKTGGALDVMIEGGGFFVVQVDPDISDGLAYTRAGKFTTNSEGELVMANSQGRRLLPEIIVPPNIDVNTIQITNDGYVWAPEPGGNQLVELGRLELALFTNNTGLGQIGENLYIQTEASGEPFIDFPTVEGRGMVMQRFLEQSNVNPVNELVGLITTQRSFDMNSQAVQAADEMLQALLRMRRF